MEMVATHSCCHRCWTVWLYLGSLVVADWMPRPHRGRTPGRILCSQVVPDLPVQILLDAWSVNQLMPWSLGWWRRESHGNLVSCVARLEEQDLLGF